MNLGPLLAESAVVQFHAFAALLALLLGAIQLAGPKGTAAHRETGYAWLS